VAIDRNADLGIFDLQVAVDVGKLLGRPHLLSRIGAQLADMRALHGVMVAIVGILPCPFGAGATSRESRDRAGGHGAGATSAIPSLGEASTTVTAGEKARSSDGVSQTPLRRRSPGAGAIRAVWIGAATLLQALIVVV